MPTKDPEKNRQYRNAWYKRNSKKEKLRNYEARKAKIAWLKEYKKNLKCNRCPETYWACLDFHHKDPKTKVDGLTMNTIIKRGWGISRLLEEISKCEVLCSNCHRKEHNPE